MCRRGYHLWDEVVSSGSGIGGGWDHYLVCDACGEEIIIDDKN